MWADSFFSADTSIGCGSIKLSLHVMQHRKGASWRRISFLGAMGGGPGYAPRFRPETVERVKTTETVETADPGLENPKVYFF